MTQKKTGIKVELKSGEGVPEGSFAAVFSQFNVIDHDGDVTLPGSFQKGAKVPLQGMGHNWDIPTIGYGVINADSEKAWIEGEFNLKMASAREHYESIKFSHEKGLNQEYSYAFDVTKKGRSEDLAAWPGAKRILAGLDVKEVSPVLLGAGIGTGTLDIKGKKLSLPNWLIALKSSPLSDEDKRAKIQEAITTQAKISSLENGGDSWDYPSVWITGTFDDYVIVCDDGVYWKYPYTITDDSVTLGDPVAVEQVWAEKGSTVIAEMKYGDHADQVLADLTALSTRSKSLADIRVKAGRQFSAANRQRIAEITDAARAAVREMEALLQDTDTDGKAKGKAEEKSRKLFLMKAQAELGMLAMQLGISE
jgi:uncharacterized membrane protein